VLCTGAPRQGGEVLKGWPRCAPRRIAEPTIPGQREKKKLGMLVAFCVAILVGVGLLALLENGSTNEARAPQSHAVCSDHGVVNGTTCSCLSGWRGNNCELECPGCLKCNAVCESCTAGFTGATCMTYDPTQTIPLAPS
jgi:hypothetical protein